MLILKTRYVTIGLLAISLMIGGMPLSSYATETPSVTTEAVQTLSMDAAIQKATDYSMMIRQIKNAKEKAMKGYSQAENGGAKAGAQLDDYLAYQNLYYAGADDPVEVMALEVFKAMFGPQPILNFEQMYDNFVIPSEVAPYQVYVQFQGLKIDEPNAISAVEYQTKQMYYGILSYQHSLLLMQDSNCITTKKIKEMELKYSVGQVSRVALEAERLNYTKSLLELEKQKQDLKVLEAQFKGLLGLSENTPLKLVDPGLLLVKEPVSYESLVDKAIKDRGDLKKSQFAIDNIVHEVKIMSQYLKDPQSDRRVDADQRLLDAKLAKANLENEIRAEILDAYNSFKQTEAQLEISKKKVELSEKQLTRMKQLLKTGYVKNLDVYSVELQLQSSKLSYESAVYNYNKQADAINRITDHALN